jgi:CubicO group peptidase (beta-lactamase class C family)
MKRIAIFFCIALLCTFSAEMSAQNKAEKIDELLKAYNNLRIFNGSVLVAEKGEVILKNGYGYANFEWEIPNSADTKFRLGSVTKQFTAMLILQLVEESKLNLDDKVSEYLDYYPKDKADKITIHHLLTHSSGIPSYTNNPDFHRNHSRTRYTPEDFIKTFMDEKLDFEPGSKFNYSNSGYFVLGAIIEKISGKTYDENLRFRIFNKAGMNNSGYDHNDIIIEKKAAGYNRLINIYRNAPFIDMSTPYSAGSLYSTVEDLYLWDQVLYTNKLLSKENLNKMFTPYIKTDLGFLYGYGWGVENKKIGNKVDSVRVISHGGSIYGFNSLIVRLVDDKNLIVLLNNTGNTNLSEIAGKIERILYDQPYEMPQKPLIDNLAEKVDEEGIASGIEFFKSSLKDGKKFSEGAMNNLGYVYLSQKKYNEAIGIFKLNVETYSESFNVYDSMGEALLASGQKEEAIVNYKKSVELNPGNENGKTILNKLGVEFEPVKNYEITYEIFEKYIGKYELNPNFIITISGDGEKYFAQATNQPILELIPRAEDSFQLAAINAQLTFVKGEDGEIEKLILHQNGKDTPAIKIE